MKDGRLEEAVAAAQVALDRIKAGIRDDAEVSDANLAERARAMLRHRRKRAAIFQSDLFGEPVWDVILALGALDERRLGVRQVDLLTVAGVAQATGMRVLQRLTVEGVVTWVDGGSWKKKKVVTLTSEGLEKLRSALT
jgi:DNA-binding MarR family transcriptional regulator